MRKTKTIFSLWKNLNKFMKNIIIILGLFSLFLFPNCEKDIVEINTAKQPEGTAVLIQIITVSDVNSNEAQTTTDFEYFNNGNLEKTSYSHSDGTILSYSNYEYNSENQLELIVDYTANSNEISGYLNLRTHEFEYLANGLKSKETINHPVIGTLEYISFDYNNEDDLIKKTFFNSDNHLVNYVIYDYDEFGNILKGTTYSNTDEQTGETLHYYRNNMLFKSDVYILGKDKVHLEEVLKTYDDDNNLIMLQSNILWLASSRSSSVLKFIYE
ncbi:MAG: hypothetical protein DRJ07_03860 [Bacteroidetes bacterium]|nr:MAG: hypothetical protein DRJ07_03860 [Bacteroidota bacterium]